MLLYAGVLQKIDHLMSQSVLLLFRSQMYLESSVRLAYFFLFRKESACCVKRCLNVPMVSPMYFLSTESLLVATLASY